MISELIPLYILIKFNKHHAILLTRIIKIENQKGLFPNKTLFLSFHFCSIA